MASRFVIMILVIIGYGRTGKDTAANFLRKHTTLRYVGSTSWVALPFVADHLNVCEQWAWDMRHDNRVAWHKHCRWLKSKDPMFLVNICLNKGGTVITGLRDRVEVEACKEAGHHVVWIDSTGRGITSDPTVVDFDDTIAHEVIPNNGGIPLFEHTLKKWAKKCRLWICDHEQKI